MRGCAELLSELNMCDEHWRIEAKEHPELWANPPLRRSRRSQTSPGSREGISCSVFPATRLPGATELPVSTIPINYRGMLPLSVPPHSTGP